MNGGSTRGQAYGVKFDVLIKLIAVKASNSKKGSLLNFVVKTMEKQDPNAGKFAESWVSMWAAAEISFKQLETDMKQLSIEIDRTKAELETNVPKLLIDNPNMGKPLEKRLKDFLSVAGPRMTELKIKLSQTDEAIRSTMAKYGEGKSGGEPEGDALKDFFVQMCTFARAYKTAYEENLKQKLDEEKKAKKDGLSAPVPLKVSIPTAVEEKADERPKENIFGNFNAAKSASPNDMIAEFKKRMQQKKQ